MCQSLFPRSSISVERNCSHSLQQVVQRNLVRHTHRGDLGTKSCLSHWPPGCLLANLIMLEANCDHPSLVVLTITSHKALGAESLLFFFDEAGSWFTFRLVLGRMKSFWVERPRTGALRHWPL